MERQDAKEGIAQEEMTEWAVSKIPSTQTEF